jgi:Ca2+-binding EF-hand superfamily protein
MALFKAFVQLDQDGSGEITIDEFHTHWQLKPTKFSTRVFDAVDLDRSQALNFREFIVGVWNFLRLDVEALVNFTFGLIDADKSGDLDKAECEALVRMLYDTDEVSKKLSSVIQKMDANGDDSITAAEFSAFCKKAPSLIKPAVKLQSKIRHKLNQQGILIGPQGIEAIVKKVAHADVDVASLLTNHDAGEEAAAEERARRAGEVGAMALKTQARRQGRIADTLHTNLRAQQQGNEWEDALSSLHALTTSFDGNEESFPALSHALELLKEAAELTKAHDKHVCEKRFEKYRAKAGRKARKDTRLYLEEPDGQKCVVASPSRPGRGAPPRLRPARTRGAPAASLALTPPSAPLSRLPPPPPARYLARRVKRAAGKQGEGSLRVQLEKEAVDDAYGKVTRHFEKERKALLARHDKMDAIIVEESHFVAEYVPFACPRPTLGSSFGCLRRHLCCSTRACSPPPAPLSLSLSLPTFPETRGSCATTAQAAKCTSSASRAVSPRGRSPLAER